MMNNFTTILICFFTLLLVVIGCKENEFDEHYARPDWLADPIYQQLEARGNFTNLLRLIDKSGYKHTLSSAGYWTMFAPNDHAFQKYLLKKSIGNINEIDSVKARKLVTYMLVYNAFKKERLKDYQSPLGWDPNRAFKRRSANYVGVYDEVVDNSNIKVTASNHNLGYTIGDNNNKYIPYFINEYFSPRGLSAADYNYFYPDKEYSGFNVAGSSVVTADIIAENGIIHEIDEVIEPIPSIDEYLVGKADYSVFKNLLEKNFVTYLTHPEVTNRYKVLTGSSDPVYVKFYSSVLAFAANNENYLKETDNDGQIDGWSIIVPKNEALNEYINKVLLRHYKSFEFLPKSIVADFLNAHMYQTTLWPSKFNSTLNYVGEPVELNKDTDIFDRKVLSNGMFYGSEKVHESKFIHSVFGSAYLNPKYSMMTRLMEGDLKYTLSNPDLKFAVFMMSDKDLNEAGFVWDLRSSSWMYKGSSSLARERLLRMLNLHVFLNFDGGLNDLSDEGLAESYNGEYVKFYNNELVAAGNIDFNTSLKVDSFEVAKNGIVYYTSGLLYYSEQKLGIDIRDNPNFSKFFEYLNNSNIYDRNTGAIKGIDAGVSYTVFIPTNEAMEQAIADGVIPTNSNPGEVYLKDRIANFILYHIINKKTVIANGKEEGVFESMYKTIDEEIMTLTVLNQFGSLQVKDMHGNSATWIPENSNLLADRTVIHQIDNYLRYKLN